MRTTNYVKISYERVVGKGTASEFCFVDADLSSRDVFCQVARFRGHAAHLAAERSTHRGAEPPRLSVFRHGIPGAGDLPCVGGCDLCTAPGPTLVEEPGDA